MRALSREWLHEELDLIESELISPELTEEAATAISDDFDALHIYGWLAPIREPQYLEQLSPEEAHECRVLWARIRGLEAVLLDLIEA